MRRANTYQVGGDHYKGHAHQPWDLIASYDLRFFEGNIVKYVTRHSQKGGVEDLRKAMHYTEKLLEEADHFRRIRSPLRRRDWPLTAVDYVDGNALGNLEAVVVINVCRWSYELKRQHLLAVQECIGLLITRVRYSAMADAARHAFYPGEVVDL